MNRSSWFLLLWTSLLVAGCATPGGGKGAAKGAAKGANEIDIPTREALLETDKAFAQLAAQRGAAEAFYAYAAEDAIYFPIGELPVHGREAIRIAMSTGSQGQLRWEPRDAEICRGGDMGYTWGFFEFSGPGVDGRPSLRHGKYVTIWQRQPDGSYKFSADIGNPGPPPRTVLP